MPLRCLFAFDSRWRRGHGPIRLVQPSPAWRSASAVDVGSRIVVRLLSAASSRSPVSIGLG